MRIVHLYLVMFFVTNVAISQNEFQKAFNDTTKPSVQNIRINLSDKAGNASHLPISIIKGKGEGPVFTVIAGVHGFEYPPIVAAQELMQEIDMQKLNGTIIIIPLASMGAFFARTPFTSPEDKVNLNGAFPGKTDGSITQQKSAFYYHKYYFCK